MSEYNEGSDLLVAGQFTMVIPYTEGKYSDFIEILKDLIKIADIELDVMYKECKNGYVIQGRYIQQVGNVVYALDKEADLFQIKWQYIKDGQYCKTEVGSCVKHFFVDKRLRLATIQLDDTLSLPGGSKKDLQTIDSKTEWKIVTCIAKCWIVSGDLDGQAIIAGISNQGKLRSTLKLQLTSNGYIKFGSIKTAASLAYARRM